MTRSHESHDSPTYYEGMWEATIGTLPYDSVIAEFPGSADFRELAFTLNADGSVFLHGVTIVDPRKLRPVLSIDGNGKIRMPCGKWVIDADELPAKPNPEDYVPSVDDPDYWKDYDSYPYNEENR